jgi:hypothetical protein
MSTVSPSGGPAASSICSGPPSAGGGDSRHLLASTGSRLLKRREKALGELGAVTDLAVLCRELETLAGPPEGGHRGKLLERIHELVRQRADEQLSRGAALFAEVTRAFALRVLAERG